MKFQNINRSLVKSLVVTCSLLSIGCNSEEQTKGDSEERTSAVTENTNNLAIKGDKGDKGDRGDKGEKGDTVEAGIAVNSIVGSQGLQGVPGKNGIDGFNASLSGCSIVITSKDIRENRLQSIFDVKTFLSSPLGQSKCGNQALPSVLTLVFESNTSFPMSDLTEYVQARNLVLIGDEIEISQVSPLDEKFESVEVRTNKLKLSRYLTGSIKFDFSQVNNLEIAGNPNYSDFNRFIVNAITVIWPKTHVSIGQTRAFRFYHTRNRKDFYADGGSAFVIDNLKIGTAAQPLTVLELHSYFGAKWIIRNSNIVASHSVTGSVVNDPATESISLEVNNSRLAFLDKNSIYIGVNFLRAINSQLVTNNNTGIDHLFADRFASKIFLCMNSTLGVERPNKLSQTLPATRTIFDGSNCSVGSVDPNRPIELK